MRPASLASLASIVLVSFGCEPGSHCPPIDDPIGPDFYGTSPGLCPDDCVSQHVYREGAQVQLIVSGEDACQVRGTLSSELVETIDSSAAALLAGELEPGEPVCNFPDTGQTWLEFDAAHAYAWATGCPPANLAALDARIAAAIWALAECRETDDVTPREPCRRAY